MDEKARGARIDRLVAYLLDGLVPLPGEDFDRVLGGWLAASSRFLAFAAVHRDKIRRKLRGASEPGARGDVRAELETAFLLLADRRIDLAFEAYGSGRRGPDFTVTFRAAHRFNVEVTRPRPRNGEAGRTAAIVNAVVGKLSQLPAEAPNALLVATGLALSADEIAVTMRGLKMRADRRDEQLFAGRGLSPDEFQGLYRRLTVVLVANAIGPGAYAWSNPEARRRLPDGAAAACLACLANAQWATESSP
ncbi:MAG: hypothetical protein ACRDHF_01695 [Tepidiformaceae bacterium]